MRQVDAGVCNHAYDVGGITGLGSCGNCWSAMVRSGRCTELLNEKVSKEECCASDHVATAWSSEDLDAGTLFFWRVLGGGVPCYACKESCSGVECGEGKKCVVRRGRPKCVCSPDCRKSRHKGPVCGTDGRSYRSICRLRKRACRRKSSTLAVAYYGHCQKDQGAVIRKREHLAVDGAEGNCYYVTRQGNLCQMEHVEADSTRRLCYTV
ncbi:hypothetical protein B7P43_G04419 [Cryptotermes secundus]|uniref:Follistatin-A n=1 Tax=Cryptotermes secundus TaxID=105785 RepID=A0A2J7QJU2_9NEOP|nr:hypothetical protein B7P43_G04419 [Cryptotermes secundus]